MHPPLTSKQYQKGECCPCLFCKHECFSPKSPRICLQEFKKGRYAIRTVEKPTPYPLPQNGANVKFQSDTEPGQKTWRQTYFARPPMSNAHILLIPNPVPSTRNHPKTNTITSHVEYKDGDLFNSCDSLMHCVSADFRMGRGIAVTFRRKFGRVEKLLHQNVQPGGCGVLKESNRYIYYLVTKQRCFEKPTYNYLQASLCSARDHCIKHNIDKISMPQIGCGLDGLKWKEVADLVESVFRPTNITISVYILK